MGDVVRWSRQDDRSLNDMIGGLRSDFQASKESRFKTSLTGVSSTGSGADYHYRNAWAYYHMIERARYYERNEPTVGQGISRLEANVIQDGFAPDPATGNSELNIRLRDLWTAWSSDADNCHDEGEHDFHAMEGLVFRSSIRDGDMFTVTTRPGTLQLIEGHRPRTPNRTKHNVIHGVCLDDRGRRKELWVGKENLDPYKRHLVRDVDKVDFRDAEGKRQVLQTYFAKRTSQRRGYTALAPVSDTIGQHDDLQFTTLVKAQMNALIVILEQQQQGAQAGSGEATNLSSSTTTEPIGGLQAGLHVKARDGYQLQGHAPNVPNAEFFSHSNLLLTFVAINLDLPVALLLLDPSNTNFSGWRGAMDQAKIRWRWMQRQMLARWHRPVYTWKVRQWLAIHPELAALAMGADPYKHRWRCPAWPYIEPFKDAQADALILEKFLNSPRRVQARLGRLWEEVAEELVSDKGMLIRMALDEAAAINSEYPGAGIDWRELLGPGLTSEVKMAAPLTSPKQEKPA